MDIPNSHLKLVPMVEYLSFVKMVEKYYDGELTNWQLKYIYKFLKNNKGGMTHESNQTVIRNSYRNLTGRIQRIETDRTSRQNLLQVRRSNLPEQYYFCEETNLFHVVERTRNSS